jgi:hypothetical protein
LAQNEHVQWVNCAGMSMSKGVLAAVAASGDGHASLFVPRKGDLVAGRRAVGAQWFTSGKNLAQAFEH